MARGIGAYENPQLYGVDFTESTRILQEGMQSATDAVNAYEKQKAEARKKLEEDFADFKELQYIDKLQGVNENINNTIKTSVGLNLGLADFSQLTPDERANMQMGAKEARAFRDGLGMLIESAQNNVYDKRVPAEYEEFIYDLANGGENLEYIPNDNGIGFKLQFTDSSGETSVYDAAKIAMMTTQFSDVSEELETAGENIRKAAAQLQKRNVDGVRGVEKGDIDILTDTVWSSMDERTKQLYFAEYVKGSDGVTGRELKPKYKLVNGKKVKLSEEEAKAKAAEREVEFKNYLAREIGGQLYEVAKEKELSYEEKRRIDAKYRGGSKGSEDNALSDEDLYNKLNEIRQTYIDVEDGFAKTGEPKPFDYQEVLSRMDDLNLSSRKIMAGSKSTGIQNYFLQPDGNLVITGMKWDGGSGREIETPIAKINLKDPTSVDDLYRNILRAENRGGKIEVPKAGGDASTDAAKRAQELINKYRGNQ